MSQIDSSIYFKQQAPDVMGGIQKGMNMRQMMDESQAAKDKNLRAKSVDAAYKAGVVKNPDGSTSFNKEKTLSELANIGGREYMEGQQHFAQQAKAQREQQLQKLEMTARLAGSATDQQSYEQVKQEASKYGLDVSQLPQAYDQNLMKRYQMMALSSKEQLENQLKQGENSRQEQELGIRKQDLDLRRRELGIRSTERKDILNEKRDEKDTKREEKELALAVPGFTRTGEVLPKPEEAMKLRKAVSSSTQLSSKLSRLKELVGSHGSFEYGGEGGTEMESLATEIQLLAKSPEMYELGVLTGPDMSLLQKITADPSSMNSFFTRDSSRNKQIESQLSSISGKLNATAESMGYKKAGAAQSMSKHKEAIDWAMANPEDPRSAQILEKNGVKIGGR